MRPRDRRLAGLAAGLVLVLLAVPAWAGTRRDDKDDSLYLSLAAKPEYAAVGMLTYADGTHASGVLIAQDWFLVPGHCADISMAGASFTLSGVAYTPVEWFAHPLWAGDLTAGNDIALVRLATAVMTVTPALRYRGTGEIGLLGTTVGYGMTGTGLTGEILASGTKRAGQNRIDVDGTAVGYSANILMADFDRPSFPAESSFGSAIPENLEYSPAMGDSGAGLFIQEGSVISVAGIASFGRAGPVADPHPDGPNSAYGDLMGWTRVAPYNDWIDFYIPNYWRTLVATAPFETPQNWSANIPPGPVQQAVLDMSGPRTITFAGDATNRRLHVCHGDFTFALNGHAYTVTDTPSLVVAGEAGELAKFIISNGTVTSARTYVGEKTGAGGGIETKTAGATWHNTGAVYLGGSNTGAGGTGTLTVGAGTTVVIDGLLRVYNTGTDGTITVTGALSAGSLDLSALSATAKAPLTVNNGGVLTTGGALIGGHADTTGTVTVNSGGTWHSTGSVYVGGDASQAAPGDASGLVNIRAGATLTVDGILRIWNTGAGYFTIEGTATLGALDLTGGILSGNAALVLTGVSNAWSSGRMRCAPNGGGATVVAPGAVLTISSTATKNLAARLLENQGTVIWTDTGKISPASKASLLNAAGGVFDLRSDAMIDGDTTTPFTNEGLLVKSAGAGTSTTDCPFSNTGTVEVRTGTLSFTGAVTQLSGSTLTGGAWDVYDGATLTLTAGSAVTVNEGAVTLRGPGAVFSKINSLAENRGTLAVLGGRNFSTPGGFANSGTLALGAGGTFTVNGPYTQTAGAATFGGDLRVLGGTAAVNGGTLSVAHDLGAAGSLALTVGGGTVHFGSGQHLASLGVTGGGVGVEAGGNHTLVTRGLTVSGPTAFLDVADNALLIDYALGASPLVQVTGWVRSGFTSGPGGWWDGPGIQSTAAANDAAYATALGVLDNTHEFLGGLTQFGGETLDADGSDILVKYTWWGDIDFDGQVTLTDYSVFLYYFFEQANMTPDQMGWWSADLDYDGTVTLTDYNLLLYGFLSQTGPLEGGGSPSPVPEPATLALLVLGGLMALGRAAR